VGIIVPQGSADLAAMWEWPRVSTGEFCLIT
jgi:hypothetical protein